MVLLKATWYVIKTSIQPNCETRKTLSSLPLQIQKVILALGDYMGAGCHACIGGTNVRNEATKLQAEAPHIVVGTPGRVFDMLSREYLGKGLFSD